MTISSPTLNRLTYAACFVCIVAALWAGDVMQKTESLFPLVFAGPVLIGASVLVAINEKRKKAER